MSILSQQCEEDALRKLRKRAKATEKPVIPGKFVVVSFFPGEPPQDGKRQRKHECCRYAVNIEHAKQKVMADYPGCQIGEVRCYSYEVARIKLTQRSGSLMSVITTQDREELRNDLLAWEATRDRIVLDPPQHRLTLEATTGTRTAVHPLPIPSAAPVLTFERLLDELSSDFVITKPQLIGVLRHNKLPVTKKKDERGNLMFSELDVWVIRRFLRFEKPRFIRPGASESVT